MLQKLSYFVKLHILITNKNIHKKIESSSCQKIGGQLGLLSHPCFSENYSIKNKRKPFIKKIIWKFCFNYSKPESKSKHVLNQKRSEIK